MAVSFITITFLYFFFHNPDSLICVSENRNAICAQEYNPVCALYSGNDCDSPTGYCVKTVNSACDACSDVSIAGYILGECPYMPVQPCSQEHDLNSCTAMELQGTVCGIQQDPQQSDQLIKTVWDDGCQACNAGDASFYLGGETLGECIAVSTSNICQPQDRNVQNCEWSAMPACAYYTGGDCTEGVCRKTMDSYCTACADENVMFYLNGDCADLVPIGGDGTGPITEPGDEEESVPEEEVIEEEVLAEEDVPEEEENVESETNTAEEEDVPEEEVPEEEVSEEEYVVESEPIVDSAAEEEDVPEEEVPEEEVPEEEYVVVESETIIDYAAEEEDVPEEEVPEEEVSEEEYVVVESETIIDYAAEEEDVPEEEVPEEEYVVVESETIVDYAAEEEDVPEEEVPEEEAPEEEYVVVESETIIDYAAEEEDVPEEEVPEEEYVVVESETIIDYAAEEEDVPEEEVQEDEPEDGARVLRSSWRVNH